MLETISEEEFYEAMKKISEKLHENGIYCDKEAAHVAMDELMCELLTMLGYNRAVQIFRDTPKWYA
jgi:hypothetical protein